MVHSDPLLECLFRMYEAMGLVPSIEATHQAQWYMPVIPAIRR